MDTLCKLNEFMSAESERILQEINKRCSEAPRCRHSESPHVIESDYICLNDIRYTDKFTEHLGNVVNSLRDRVFQSGFLAGSCVWQNIRDSEHNPLGNQGKFVVTLV